MNFFENGNKENGVRVSHRHRVGRACGSAGKPALRRAGRVLCRAPSAAARPAAVGVPGGMGHFIRHDGRGRVPDLRQQSRQSPLRGALVLCDTACGEFLLDARLFPLQGTRRRRGAARAAECFTGADDFEIQKSPPLRRMADGAVSSLDAVRTVPQSWGMGVE